MPAEPPAFCFTQWGQQEKGLRKRLELHGTAKVPAAEGTPFLLQKTERSIDCHQQIYRDKVHFNEVKGDNLSTDKNVPQSVKHSSNRAADNRAYNEGRD